MSKKIIPLFVFAGAALLSIGLINVAKPHHSHGIDEKYIDKNGNLTEPIDIATHTEDEKPEGKYEENVVLVKTYQEIDTKQIDLDVKSIDELYPNSSWKKITLEKTDAFSAVKKLRKTNLFEKVDYNYIMASEEIEIESIDVSSNPNAGDLPYIESNGVGNAWGWGKYKHNHGEENIDAGGSPDVIIAVIDTGVDYNHVDLRNNIWTNTAEIPDNGVDDDGNGYIDDVRGWDCANEDNDPIDDNGHGTHVAGIIAAENNNIGTVGVAFNCKIMPIKASAASGFFTSEDIAQAIEYAYMNGASVINMSFGGASLSLATEEALENAYPHSVLVAAAGNNALCNQFDCFDHFPLAKPFYPASLPYVVGVMSCDDTATLPSSFSNYDHYPNNYWEYECYACGEQIYSTWPNNKIARLSGTSMASPVVAGIAALVRSAYPNKEVYSSKYINSQLTNTGTQFVITDSNHPVCDAYNALTAIPKPFIYNVYNSYGFDNIALSSKNNGDGFIDAGETIKLGVELMNKGGKAKNISLTIDDCIMNDPNLDDPNIDIIKDHIEINDIGTYSVGDCGNIYEDGKVVDIENGFLLKIADNTPNGYICLLDLHITYMNGLDESDTNIYSGDTMIEIEVSSGTRLSGVITQDTIFTADKTYLIDDIITIPEGITVQFEEGSIIQFYDSSDAIIDTSMNTPGFDVYGELLFNGSEENKIVLRPSLSRNGYVFDISPKTPSSRIVLDHCNITNLDSNVDMESLTIINSLLQYDVEEAMGGLYRITNGQSEWDPSIDIDYVHNCVVNFAKCKAPRFTFRKIKNSLIYLGTSVAYFSPTEIICREEYSNNVFVNTDAGYHFLNYSTRIDNPTNFTNNAILSNYIPTSLSLMNSFVLGNSESRNINSNYLSNLYRTYSDRLFLGNIKSDGTQICDFSDSSGHDASALFPYVTNVEITDSNNQLVNTVGVGTYKAKLTFSREMDTNSNLELRYGSNYPYSDYLVNGSFTSELTWEGTFEVKSTIEGGKQRFSLSGGHAKNDEFKVCADNVGSFEFNIDVSQAMSMNLQANPTDQGVELTWAQDDFDTLMGYNIYRSESNDGNYVRINSSVIPAGENTFLDDSCEPGKEYWYTFTIVLSDFSESAPAGKVSATPIDTISPTIYHNPVNQGYANNNLVISCTASDNIAVQSATLYYRTVGDAEWKSLSMSKANDRFSATIFGSEVTMAGIEYYISVTDGRNVVTRGSADNPYTVTIKDPSLLDNLGDVDGDGAITTKDALMIVRAINDELILTDDQFHRADLNKDGVLSTFEALRILQYVNGKVNTLEM